ncbi:hypothetical protein FHX64_002868 [Microbacter margulisiae]|uniref:Uncharacterized protein n=1 Tax=Microbacter margulisiae TaxID=1350067 RepID=A0A7W5DTZ9_9PORP|nr:hypothetical protein [Microbacter margulisiae]
MISNHKNCRESLFLYDKTQSLHYEAITQKSVIQKHSE